jgi:outer membrane protein OmpA-like peptidoglycan-associated protein
MKKLLFVFVLSLVICSIQNTQAQIFDKIKKETEKTIKKEIEKQPEVKEEPQKTNEGNTNDGKQDSTKDIKNNKVNETGTKETEQNTQVVISSKYDFVPGEKIIFYDDFTAENIGDFPIQWNTTGSGEVVTTNIADGRWFYITNARGITTLDSPVELPENYTIEFDVIKQQDLKNNKISNFTFFILSTSKPKELNYGLARPGDAAISFRFEYNNYYTAFYRDGTPDLSGIENEPKLLADKKYRISIWVQKERIRLYVGETKLFDLPKAMSKNYKYNMIRFSGGIPMISNVRIATGLPDMRNKLLTEGKLISYGIYFDVNKDIVKPESYPSIKEIAAILKDNPTVKIKIVGHTDSDGDDKSNLDLSKRRAASVKNTLVKDFGIDAARIETDGKGESEPVAKNDSAVNKALNRRVEFIKL